MRVVKNLEKHAVKKLIMELLMNPYSLCGSLVLLLVNKQYYLKRVRFSIPVKKTTDPIEFFNTAIYAPLKKPLYPSLDRTN